MEHKEYGEGFVDGFNAALKSEYLKEKFQAVERAELKARIKELETQINQIYAITYGTYQSMIQNQNQCMNLASLINAYPFQTRY